MDKPNVLFDPVFMKAVAMGWGITVAGALVLLVCGIWWSAANKSRAIDQAPVGWRPLALLGGALFVVGLVWQVIGYGTIGAATFR